MQTDVYRLWSSKIVTFTVWALAAGSGIYWGLKLSGTSASTALAALAAPSPPPDSPTALARALGGALPAPQASNNPTPPVAASRYALVGVVAGLSQKGVALIAIDGQEAKPVPVGAPLEGGLVLESVSGRRAVLSSQSDAGAKVTLELPTLNN